MKYRILSNGEDYLIQIRPFCYWQYIKKYYHTGCFENPCGSYPMSFKSEIEAEKYMEKLFGLSAERKRYYKII